MQAYTISTADSMSAVGSKYKRTHKINKKIGKRTAKAKAKNYGGSNSRKEIYNFSPNYKESV